VRGLQRLLDGSLSLDVIQGEQVLHVRLGDAAVMAEQLHAMADMAERPNVDVRILTFDAGQHEIRRLDSSCIFTHPWGTPTLCLEGYGGRTKTGHSHDCKAALRPERDNCKDQNAIAVYIDGLHVGYLPRELARSFIPVAERLGGQSRGV
jgi:hypothetical protein